MCSCGLYPPVSGRLHYHPAPQVSQSRCRDPFCLAADDWLTTGPVQVAHSAVCSAVSGHAVAPMFKQLRDTAVDVGVQTPLLEAAFSSLGRIPPGELLGPT